MRDFAQELWSMSLLLQGIAVIRRANNGYFIRDYFPVLSLALRCDQRSSHQYGSAGDQPLHRRIIRQAVFGDDLQIPQAGAVVEFDKGKILGITTRSHPALHQYGRDGRSPIQCIVDRRRRQHGGRWTKRRTHSSDGDAASKRSPALRLPTNKMEGAALLARHSRATAGHSRSVLMKGGADARCGKMRDVATNLPSCEPQTRHPQSAL